MAELIADGVDDSLVPSKSPHMLPRQPKHVIELPKQSKDQIRMAALEKVKNKYDVKFVLKQQIEFYESVISKTIGKQ